MHDEDSIELNYWHSLFLMFASFPVCISHDELILIRQHRSHHRVRGPAYALTRFFLLGPIHCHCCPCVDQQTKLSSVKSVWMKKNINIARNVIWLVPWSFYYMQNMNVCWELKTNIKWLSFLNNTRSRSGWAMIFALPVVLFIFPHTWQLLNVPVSSNFGVILYVPLWLGLCILSTFLCQAPEQDTNVEWHKWN